MRIGIFGSAQDPQCQALTRELLRHGVGVAMVESEALNQGVACHFDGARFSYAGDPLDDVLAWFVRHVMSPLPPHFELQGQYHFFANWYVEYMQRRERQGYFLAWLVSLAQRGIPLVNPPAFGALTQLKALQLAVAREVGLPTPRSCVTNDAAAVRAFMQEVGEVVYKPSMGGGPCAALDAEALQRLSLIARAPVIFQERVRGTPVRLVLVGDALTAAYSWRSATLDYRDDPDFLAGRARYKSLTLPTDLIARCRQLMQRCGLLFTAMDLLRTKGGEYLFLEANGSPTYLHLEQQTRAPITAALAELLLCLASAPTRHQRELAETRHAESFCAYAVPANPRARVGAMRARAPGPKRKKSQSFPGQTV